MVRFPAINQSINQFINVNTWDGLAPIIRARGSCIKRMTNTTQQSMSKILEEFWLMRTRWVCKERKGKIHSLRCQQPRSRSPRFLVHALLPWRAENLSESSSFQRQWRFDIFKHQFGCHRKGWTHLSKNRARMFTSRIEHLTMVKMCLESYVKKTTKDNSW